MITKEQELIMALRKNGRTKINNFAKEKNYPTSTMADTLHKLEKKGILNHKTHINFEKLGYPIKLLISLKTTRQAKEQLREYLLAQENINTLHEVNSGHDFHCEAIFGSVKESHSFLQNLEENNLLLEKDVHEVIETISSERFLTKADHFNKS